MKFTSLKSKKAQSAVEFLVILAIALFMIIPAAALLLRNSEESKQTISTNQINMLGSTLLVTAEEINVMSAGSSISLEINFPENIKSMHVINGELVIKQKTSSGINDIVFFSDTVNLSVGLNDSDTCSGTKDCGINISDASANLKIQHDVDGTVRLEKGYIFE